MTDYVATRWYRAPEVLLGSPEYGKPVDVWAFGCVLVEIFLGKPVFPGQSTLNQLARIIEITGLPSEMELAKLGSPLTYGMFQTLDVPENRKTILELLKTEDPRITDLLRRIFVFDPDLRITIDRVLKHPYFEEHHDDDLEYKLKVRMTSDGQYNNLSEIRQYMYELI